MNSKYHILFKKDGEYTSTGINIISSTPEGAIETYRVSFPNTTFLGLFSEEIHSMGKLVPEGIIENKKD